MLESGGMQRTFQRIGTNSREWKVTLAYVIIQQALCHDKCLRLTSIDEALNLRLKELPNKFVSSKTAMKHSSTEQFPQIIYWVEKLVLETIHQVIKYSQLQLAANPQSNKH